MIGPAALLVLLFVAVPAVIGLLNTFTNYTPTRVGWHFVGLENYRAVLSDEASRAALLNALLLALMTVPFEVILGLALAGLLRRPFRGRGLVRVLLLARGLSARLRRG